MSQEMNRVQASIIADQRNGVSKAREKINEKKQVEAKMFKHA